MHRARLACVLVLALVACSSGTKQSWRESGSSWRDGGRQFLRALGRSISGEGSPKEEWKQTGREFREAGKDTAEAIGDSIEPEESGSDPKRR